MQHFTYSEKWCYKFSANVVASCHLLQKQKSSRLIEQQLCIHCATERRKERKDVSKESIIRWSLLLYIYVSKSSNSCQWSRYLKKKNLMKKGSFLYYLLRYTSITLWVMNSFSQRLLTVVRKWCWDVVRTALRGGWSCNGIRVHLKLLKWKGSSLVSCGQPYSCPLGEVKGWDFHPFLCALI